MRAQTTIDYAIGISVFLLTAVLVFAFVPGMLQPFNAGAQEETVAADRLASQLAEGMLADPAEPYILLTDCTVEFFNETSSHPPSCAFDQDTSLSDPDGLTDRVGMAPRQRLNVTIQGDLDDDDTDVPLCRDQSGGSVIEADDGTCDPRFVAGGAPPASSGSVVTARRAVSIDGHDATLVVRMW